MESIAERYATALHGIAKEEKRTDQYLEAVSFLLRTFREFPDFYAVLTSEFIRREDRHRIIDKVFKQFDMPLLINFIDLLIDRHRLRDIKEIAKKFRYLVNADKGIEEGIAFSSQPLTDDELIKLKQALSTVRAHQVELTNRLEPNLIGGVKVTIGDEVYDGSVSHQINELLLKLRKGKAE
ncbi:MAG: ATP synthase F1 subunit delta [Bacilli bacterium]|jgi:F-type H+-transporting ATPase subunit delta|nr:ATP synthase F1 subunit delta [Bacilli bacterium]